MNKKIKLGEKRELHLCFNFILKFYIVLGMAAYAKKQK